ncbi:MAG: hypothetical protein DRQ78_10645 [Epsilonproteobacteria bacterium]|nr:MAG: hypothetical protein DRQ78_10645 [Campylobacterota bacterium]
MIRHAFTMLELVFTIAILAIVSSMSASVVANVYDNYLGQKSLYNASIKSELAVEQIANRLSYSIPSLVAARDPDTYSDVKVLERITGGDHTHTVLEWIAYDNDSFSAQRKPGWSAFADLNSSSHGSINTPGSDLNATDTIIQNLSGGDIGLNAGASRPIIIFAGTYYQNTSGIDYNITCLGLGSSPISNQNSADACVIPITSNNFANAHDRINFVVDKNISHSEFYRLAWSAYAISAENKTGIAGTSNISFDLFLYSNYQPWDNEIYTDGDKNLLIRNVAVFKFLETGQTLRFKLCVREGIANLKSHVTSCKEKVIAR